MGGQRRLKKTGTVATPTRVTPAPATKDVAPTLRSKADECHAIANEQIPTGDTVFFKEG
jgi:hypothetical protein